MIPCESCGIPSLWMSKGICSLCRDIGEEEFGARRLSRNIIIPADLMFQPPRKSTVRLLVAGEPWNPEVFK